MNRALWEKAAREGKWLMAACCLLLFSFHWIHVWVTSQFATQQMRRLMMFVPDIVKDLFPVPLEVIVRPAGRLAMAYDDPVVLVVVCIWAIGRSSDAVSGEIGRGSMEMLLAQPVRRIHVLLIHSAVTVIGLAALCASGWLGTWAGVATIELETEVPARIYLAPASNLFSMGFFLAGLTTLVSAADRYRARTIGIVVGFFVIQTIVKLIAVSVPVMEWGKNFTIMSALEPQVLAYAFWPEVLADAPGESWWLLAQHNGVLLVLGVLCYAGAAAVFSHRDLPAPL